MPVPSLAPRPSIPSPYPLLQGAASEKDLLGALDTPLNFKGLLSNPRGGGAWGSKAQALPQDSREGRGPLGTQQS